MTRQRLFCPQTALGPKPLLVLPTLSNSGLAVRGGAVQSLLSPARHGSGSSSTGWPLTHAP